MSDEIIIETTSQEVIEVGVPGPQGPAGAAGTGIETLTSKGDLLSRSDSAAIRVGIGSTGQILRVSASGIPEWGAAPASGVSSVNGETGAVTLTPADLDAAEANHAHNSADVFFQGLEILGAGNANVNGVYVYGGDLNGKGVYYKDKDTFVYWDGAAWTVSYNSNDIYSSAQNTTTPWQVTSWSVESGQTSPAPSSWDRLTGDQWEAVVGQRINPTLRGDAASKNVGTGANDVAAGNHTHSAATQSVAGFLSTTDKTKLDGLGTASTKDAPATGNASSTQVVLGSDTRLSDARQPLSHSSTHHTGGTDAIAPNNISAAWAQVISSAFITGNTLLSAGRNRRISLSVTNTANVDLPYENNSNGDLITVVKTATGSATATIRGAAALSGGVPIAYTTLATLNATGQSFTFVSDGTATGWSLRAVDTHTHTFGTTAGTFTQGNDTRLSDSRTPTAHAASHAAGGSDPVELNSLAATGADADMVLAGDGDGTASWQTISSLAAPNIGPDDIGAAHADHTHGNITNDGKVGSTAGLPVVTTTAGAVTTLALGTAGQVLRTKSDLSGVEFADPAASGVTGAAASASDVLGVSGANITGVDANADRIVYWNNTANKLAYGTPADAGAAAASHTHAASDITSGLAASATTDTTNASNISSGTLGTARLGTGTANSGTFLRGDQTWAAAGGVTTGSVDNAIIRADGTGGSTSQSSDLVIDDYTASTQGNITLAARLVSFSCTATASDDFVTATGHTFVNGDQVVFTTLTGGAGLTTDTRYFVVSSATDQFKCSTTLGGSAVNITTNATAGTVQRITAIVLTPNNVGALIMGPKPDGAATVGGNARGIRAVDLQVLRTNAIQVASGLESTVIGGNTNRASGDQSVVIGGVSNVASAGQTSVVGSFLSTASTAGAFIGGGFSNTASGGNAAVAGGQSCTASANHSGIIAGFQTSATAINAFATGDNALADRRSMHATTGGSFAAQGDSQRVRVVLRNKTTTNAAVELFIVVSNTTRLTIPSGKVMAMLVNITGTKSDGSAVAHYVRQYAIKNVGGTTSQVYAAATVGTDNAAGTSIALSANDTNDAVKIEATGITSETWRWVASVDAVEVAYGT